MSEMKNSAPPIEVHDLTVAYRKKPALWDIDFKLPEGKLIGMVGPNGAGKSTLIKAIMGLLPLVSGYVKIHGKPLDSMRHIIGYVPQRESVDWDFPTDALDVVTMGRYGKLGLFQRPTAHDKELAMEALRKVAMAELAHRQISQLSGGQQQRVFLARALVQDVQIYLMDEPLAGVDASTEKAIIELLQELKTRGKTLLIVHHDLNTVVEYFDWVMLINLRLVKLGPVNEVYNDENLKLTYGGKLNLLSEMAERVGRTP